MELSSQDHDSQLLSRIATNGGHGENSYYFDGWKAHDRDPYHPVRNPKGVIQMGLAENQLCHDLIEEWLRKNPTASICTAEGVSQFRDIALFQDYHGLPAFRNAVAKFMEKVRGGKVKFNPDRIVMSGGATGAQELMAFCLADPGDAFLVPSPYYPGSDRDFCWRTGVNLIPVHCKSSNKFKLTACALKSAYDKAINSNINVKGILITNPSNPLGTLMDRDTLRSLLEFINERKIHLVCDEIFAGTVFDRSEFTSIAEVLQESEDYDRGLVHIVYSLSKDLGLPGFRVGLVYSYNDTVVNIGRKMSSFGLVSSQTQHLLSSMLADDAFTTELLAETARRLAERQRNFTEGLEDVGIQCLRSTAGLFCWMDLRRLMKEQTVDGEAALWRLIVNDVKLNVSPGTSFRCHEPGWFRVCYANMDDETMEEALRRIRSFVFAAKKEEEEKKKKRWQAGLRLSMPKRFDEMTRTPTLMSPRSPLVQAT